MKSAVFLALFVAGCSNVSTDNVATPTEAPRLPTGVWLDPAGKITDLGSLPMAMVPSPDNSSFVVLLNGYRENGIQVVNRATGLVTQTITQRAAFIGLTFSPDGKHLYASGGNDDAIYVYDWIDGKASIADPIVLNAKKKQSQDGRKYPAGIAISPDGATLYVAENLGDSLAVVDIATGSVKQRLATERYPYGVAVAPNGAVYVSNWGGSTVSMFKPSNGKLEPVARIPVGRHPSSMILTKDGSRLFAASGGSDLVSVVDTRAMKRIAEISVAIPGGTGEGSTPNALALSPDETRLYVAEGDNNAVSIVNLSSNAVVGRIPAGWYPASVIATRDSLFVLNAKGRGTKPNPHGPVRRHGPRYERAQHTLGQLNGTLMSMSLPQSTAELAQLSARVARANWWSARPAFTGYPPIEHVIYIIKENRTYDQVFGDLTQADGDTSLLFFPREVAPNHHALAERFGIFDRFFVNAEVSADGHNWSTAAYVTDYGEKTISQNYSDRGRTYDYEGTNRDSLTDDDVAEPAAGYLWNLAEKSGITFRNYGEFVIEIGPRSSRIYRGAKPYLVSRTNEQYPTFDMDISDQRRADVWLADFRQFERDGRMPQLHIMRLTSDHTSGASAGKPTPRAYFADNDLALGRIIEALSKSQFWRSTVVFVLEDDAQDGSDHVDSHRSPMLVISPWTKGGVFHRFANTSDVIATIEEILKLGTMSQFDHFGRPLREIWASKPNLTPYAKLTPSVPLDEMNPSRGYLAEESKKLALQKEDMADEDLFNRILWRAIKGESKPWPGATRLSGVSLTNTQ
jgi:YVTN family beta-propeller protein